MKMIISLFTFLPFIVFGQVIKPITINSYETTAPTLQYYQANEITIPVYLKNGTNAANITGMTPFFSWSSGTNASGIMTAACAVVNSTQGFFNATFSQESLNANGYFIYEAGAKTNGKPVVYRQGVFQLIRSPYAAGVGPAQLSTNIDFAIYTPVNAPWILTNAIDNVTLIWDNGVLKSQGSEAPDLTARAAIIAETNRAQVAEAALYPRSNPSNFVGSAALAGYVETNDPRIVNALTNPAQFATAAQGERADLALTNAAAFDPAGSAAGVSNLLSGYVPTDDPAYLASITGAVYGAQDGPTIAGGVLTVGTNLFGGGTGGTGGGNVASVTGTGGLVNVGLTTGAVFIALSDATTQSLAKADAAVLTTTPGYTNATAHAGSGHGVSADGGFYGGTSPENIGQGGGIGLGAVARYGGAAGWQAVAFDGGSVGDGAASDDGGAVGKSAKAGDGFAGGKNAFATDDGTLTGTRIDAIQLGSGGNTNPLSLQIYGYQLMSSAGFVPVARLNSIPTNALDATADQAYRNPDGLITNGQTVTLYSTNASPSGSELVSLNYVNSRLNSGVFYYDSTNTIVNGYSATGYVYQATDPAPFNRSYGIASNNQYVREVFTPSLLTNATGPATVTIHARVSGGGNPTVTLRPELHFTADLTNTIYEAVDVSQQTISGSTTSNSYQWVFSFPQQTTPVYAMSRLKVISFSGTPTLTLYGGSNQVSTLAINSSSSGGDTGGGVTALQVTNIANAAAAQWATNPATAGVYLGTNAMIFVGGGKTNTLTFNGTNFISVITP